MAGFRSISPGADHGRRRIGIGRQSAGRRSHSISAPRWRSGSARGRGGSGCVSMPRRAGSNWCCRTACRPRSGCGFSRQARLGSGPARSTAAAGAVCRRRRRAGAGGSASDSPLARGRGGAGDGCGWRDLGARRSARICRAASATILPCSPLTNWRGGRGRSPPASAARWQKSVCATPKAAGAAARHRQPVVQLAADLCSRARSSTMSSPMRWRISPR